MPDISLPEVRLPEIKLPESLRDMNREDIQKAMPDVRLPKIELPKRADIAKELSKAGREIEKAGREAGREIEKAGRDLDKALPRRPAPSPLPFVFFGLLAGLFIGWFLASSTVTGPRINGIVGDVRGRVDRWRKESAKDTTDEFDATSSTYPDALRTPMTSEPYSGDGGTGDNGVGVGPGRQPVGSAEGVSSERF